ncbi:MAG: hypothetical protein WBD63_06740 [Phycisphaerae bacterium]|nr:hypothetical protein [Phycisphaerae bacterium]
MSNITPEPDDILGMRSGGERRAGTAQLLRAGLGLLRHHGLRAWGLAVLALAILFGIMQLAFTPFSIGPYIFEDLHFAGWWWTWGWPTAALANILAGAPFAAAYAYALFLLLQQRRAGAGTLFSPFRSAVLLANTIIAGSAAPLVEWLIRWLRWRIPWSEIYSNLVAKDSLLDETFRLVPMPGWIMADLPKWIGILLAVPLAWSALNVLVLGDSGVQGIARSVRLVRHYWRLAALYLVAAVLLPLTLWALAPLWDFAATLNTGAARGLFSGLPIFCSLLISSVNLLLENLVLVLVYREMLWREQEAAGPAPLDSPTPAP